MLSLSSRSSGLKDGNGRFDENTALFSHAYS
jgi:hypothetical protein